MNRLLLSAIALVIPVLALAQPVPNVPRPNVVGGYPQLDASTHVLGDNIPHPVAVARHAQFGGGITAPAITSGARTGITSRMWEQSPTTGALTAIRLVLSGYYSNLASNADVTNGFSEAPGLNPVTCTASIETNPTLGLAGWANNTAGVVVSPPFAFNGLTSVTLATTGTVRSDWLNVYLPAGTTYYLRTYCSETIAGKIPVRAVSQTSRFEGSNSGLSGFLTFGTGNGVLTTFSFTPSASFIPIAPGTIVFSVAGAANVTDNGSGGCPVAGGVSSCTINYATGSISITTTAPVANAANIVGSMVGGAQAGDQTQSTALNPFTYQNVNFTNNPVIGPISIEGLQATGTGPRIRGVGVMGDSINTGIGDNNGSIVMSDTSWIDYSAAGRFGIAKGSISGEQLAIWSWATTRTARLSLLGSAVDRIIDNEATNDIPNGKSISQTVNYFLKGQPSLAGVLPHGPLDLWWVTVLPRTTTPSSGVYTVVGSGPYTATGAGYGAGAVVSPTPLGGAYASATIGNGIQSCTLTGTNSVGPYTCSFSGATMPGSLWSDGATTTVIDTGSGGTSATTLTGSGVTTGTHTPSTGAVSVTLSSALATGATVKLYAYLTGPSARNAWNYFLYNWALPKGLIGGVVDTASCLEASPGSNTGSGNGLWANSTYTLEGTHPSFLGHSSIIPACIGPTGTTPSAVWTFAP